MKKRVISFLIVFIMIFNINPVKSSNFFYDTIGHWAFEDIFWASNDVKLFVGYPDGSFGPDNNITRSEFVTLLYRAADANGLINNSQTIFDVNKTSIGDNTFDYKDLSEEFWAYENIEKVFENILSLDNEITMKDIFSDEIFKPYKPITREEAVLLSQAYSLPPIENIELNFTDINDKYKYIKQLKEVVNNKIIIGNDDNTFKPYDNITRAESAALIKRVYYEMRYLKDDYLTKINLIKNIYDEKFMYFGDYFNNKNLSNQDLKYVKVISTLEMLDIYGRIPYNERENYDLSPYETLKELKENNYWNTIGINYYLIKSGELDDSTIVKYTSEIIEDYLNRENIKDNEYMKLIELMVKHIDNEDKILQSIDKWEENIANEYEKLNVLFLKEKIFINNNDYDSALGLFDGKYLDSEFIFNTFEHKMLFTFNKSKLLLDMNMFDEAVELLESQWNNIKNSENYIEYQETIDKEFIGSIKKVLTYKNINEKQSLLKITND